MVSQLGSAEREQLRILDRALRSMDTALIEPTMRGGVALANALRSEFPDLDDVTIGRVALALGTFAGRCGAHGDGSHEVVTLGNQIIAAALDLMSTEWQTL